MLTGNQANSGEGGGVSNSNFSSVTITACTIAGNSAGGGGGVNVLSDGEATIHRQHALREQLRHRRQRRRYS